MRSLPFDRITLTDGTVLDVEPVTPRPLPPYDPKKDRKTTTKERIPPEGNIFLPSQKEEIAAAEKVRKQQEKAREPQYSEITVKPLGQDNLFKIKRANIKSIAYFEDLLLAESESLLRKKEYARAFDHDLRVHQRAPNWVGLSEHVNRLLFEEGRAVLADKQVERGLRLLRELHARKADFPGLADELAKAYRERIEHAFEAGAYADGRKVLHELEGLTPDHAIVREARARYEAKAQELVSAAGKAAGAERLDALTEALRVWPRHDEAARQFTAAFAALPTLDVAVLDLPRALGPWLRSPADARVSRLVFLPLFAAEDEDALHGRRNDQLATALDTADLGRRLTLTLREGPRWSDGSGPVTSRDVLRSLAECANPDSPRYLARWALLMDRVEASDDRHVTIRLSRTVLKPASWLLGPIGPAHAGRDGLVPTPDGTRRLVGNGPFPHVEPTEKAFTFLAAGKATGAIRRVREIRFADAAAALDALQRGAVTLIERVPPDQVAALSKHPEIQVGQYQQPRVHVLALDGRNRALRNRTLRRGISYAIDRKGLLEETLLHHAGNEANVPADGVFVRGSYADAPGVTPLGSDARLARMLVAAARKEMGGALSTLTLAYPAVPEARAAVPKIAEALRAAGLDLSLVERSETELEMDLRSGKRFDLAYRVLTCDEPVRDAGRLICPGYDAPPRADALAAVASPRILQLLLQLENASEFPSARAGAPDRPRGARRAAGHSALASRRPLRLAHPVTRPRRDRRRPL